MSNIKFDFADRIVVVTGAADGIGRAVAEGFHGAGADVHVLDIDIERGQSVGAQVGRFHPCDVTDEQAVREVIEIISDDAGRIDVLVNNAGGFWSQRQTEDTDLEEWRRVVDLNLTAPFIVTRAAIPLLRRSECGRIINLGSLAGELTSYRTSPPYAASKAGVHSLTRVLAAELAGEGITVNAIAPSAVLTDRIRAVRGAAERADTAATIPLGRYQEPAELAVWVLFLASSEAGFATGQTIGVNGGRYMG